MHILPLILSVWSYRQHVTEAYLKSITGTAVSYEGENPRLQLSADGELSLMRGQTGLMSPDEVESIRSRRRERPAAPPKQGSGNEMIGSHFASDEITHNGTDAWESLKSRLAENDIHIDDDRVAELSAGFFAERKMQEVLGHTNKQKLRDELCADSIDYRGDLRFDARWVRDIESRPDREEVAAECYAEIQKNFPRAIGVEIRRTETAIAFDPNVVEVNAVTIQTDPDPATAQPIIDYGRARNVHDNGGPFVNY